MVGGLSDKGFGAVGRMSKNIIMAEAVTLSFAAAGVRRAAAGGGQRPAGGSGYGMLSLCSPAPPLCAPLLCTLTERLV